MWRTLIVVTVVLLLAACAGARRPDRGTISLEGARIYEEGERDLGHGRALLAPQFPEYLFTRSTVAESTG